MYCLESLTMSVIERTGIQIQVGQRYRVEKVVTEELIEAYSLVSSDRNPLHLDPNYARHTRFGERIAHGMLGAGLISAALASMSGCESTLIYREQTLRFHRPVKVGDTLTAVAEVVGIESNGTIHAATSCRNQRNKLVIDGEAVGLADPYPYDES